MWAAPCGRRQPHVHPMQVRAVNRVEDQNLPCMATGEADVDGALLPVACDLWQGHDRSHFDQAQIVFWGREHRGVEHVFRPGQATS